MGARKREGGASVPVVVEQRGEERRERVARPTVRGDAELGAVDVVVAARARGRCSREPPNLVDRLVALSARDLGVSAVERETSFGVGGGVDRAGEEAVGVVACQAPPP